MRSILIFISALSCACGGAGGYSGVLVSGMDEAGLEGVRLVAKASPPSADMTCQVRETTTGPSGAFSFADFCRDQAYTLTLPDKTLHLSGANTVSGGEQTAPGRHSAWRGPDGQGIFRLTADKVQPLPTFSDVVRDEAVDGTPVLYPDMKPTGKVLTISAGEYLVIAGKKWVKAQRLQPLVSVSGRQRLSSGTITDHVYIGVGFKGTKPEAVTVAVDESKTKEVLIRGKGVRYIAHDAVPAGRYALMGEADARVTILDFGQSQTSEK
jgi:hypothetical protein